MTDRSGLAEALKAEAVARGFALAGIATPEASAHLGPYRAWLAEGRHGEMHYLERDDSVARRGDLTATMENVRSVLVVAHEYYAEDAPGVVDDPSRGIVARYARGRDYHDVVKKKLLGLLAWLREQAGGVEGRAYVDTGPILERELAQRAGLGWFGRNTMLIHPRRGSYFFVGLLLIDRELPADAPFAADHCGSCRACLDACPTGALLGRDERGAPIMDARRCISYLTIELRGPIPRLLRPLVGNRIFGCDICQEVCPWNERFARPATEPAYAARAPGEDPGTDAPSLVALLRMSRAEWTRLSRGSPLRRTGYPGFKRNVAVAVGNWLRGLGAAPREAVDALAGALDDEEALVRGHAAWALGFVRTEAARVLLTDRLARESEEHVRDEIALALEGGT